MKNSPYSLKTGFLLQSVAVKSISFTEEKQIHTLRMYLSRKYRLKNYAMNKQQAAGYNNQRLVIIALLSEYSESVYESSKASNNPSRPAGRRR